MKYIDADRLRVEIENLIEKYSSVEAKGPILEGYKGGRLIGYRDVINKLNSLQQEQLEVQNGKFVFPKLLYARTMDNKTIDISYVPQNMDAVEYIRNDFIEQPEVELEKEIRNCFSKWTYDYYTGVITMDNGIVATLSSILNVARHFYEFGRNARKE